MKSLIFFVSSVADLLDQNESWGVIVRAIKVVFTTTFLLLLFFPFFVFCMFKLLLLVGSRVRCKYMEVEAIEEGQDE